MKPGASIGPSIASVFVGQAGLHEGDCAILTGPGGANVYEVGHAIVDM